MLFILEQRKGRKEGVRERKWKERGKGGRE